MSNGREGGVIYIHGHDVTVKNAITDFTYASKDGGAIFVDGANATITDSSFTRSNSTSSRGGSIYVKGKNTTISNSNFTMSNAVTNGGAIYIEGDLADVLDCQFNLSTVNSGNGGGIYVGGNNATVGGAVSTMSQANAGLGGFAYIEGNDVLVIDSKVIQSISKAGGAIYVDGKDTVINNLTTLMTTASTDGGAVYIGTGKGESGLRTKILNSHFSMSNATVKGGAVYINGMYATVENSTFNLTYAKKSSSYDTSNLGGAIYIEGNYANVIGSNFTNSFAYEGGIIYLKGQYCNVYNSTLDKGYSYNHGGAFYSTGTDSSVYYSNFTNNVARGDGGALMWLGSKYNYVVGCIFDNNTAYAYSTHSTRGGGAIYFAEGGSYCGIKDSQFFHNSVQSSVKADGGAILWDKSNHIYIDNCLFDGNYAISSNTADSIWIQGGVMYARPDNNMTISNSEFRNCWSLKEAGALYLQGGGSLGFKLINNTFINNTAKGAKVTNDNDLGGGAILIKGVNTISIVNANFTNNTANFGGAIVIHSLTGASICTITNATFDGNKAILGGQICGKGGGIYSLKPFTANNLTFMNGEAANAGGGMFISNVEMTYTDLTFINNTAEINGGGLYWDRNAVTINSMTFINNSAATGGAIYIPKGGSSTSLLTTVSNSNFTDNSADYGGAIYANGGHMVFSYNNFTNNSAVFDGGAIYTPVSNNGVDIAYSNFIGNTAAGDGGAIYSGNQGSTNRNIHDSNFTNNSALNGGAVYIANDYQVIQSCNFDGNNATRDGGAVYVNEGLQQVKILSSIFKNSHADSAGAVYYGGSTRNPLLIKDSDFFNNTAVHNGGAILYVTNSGLNIYRDYNNFDGIGVILSSGRTDVKTNDTNYKFIDNCLFEENYDYALRIRVVSDWEYPFIAVYLENPKDWRSDKLKFVVNLTDSTTHEVIHTVIINSSNIDTHYRDGMLYVSFADLKMEQWYNITVSFEDRDYMYKTNSTLEQSHGKVMGQFKLLQKLIEDAIRRGDSEIVLNRTFTFTPEIDGVTENMDDRCINLTDINYPFTIRGENWLIDAAGYSRIFYITSPYVTIENVVLTGGNANGTYGDPMYHDGDKGGAIYWAGANGTLSGSKILNNTASIGGGIYYNVTANDCKIINTTFESNDAVTNGGAIDCNASRMELINTTFIKNTAYIGGALCREINATSGKGHNNTFSDNYAEYAGAALAWINATRISIDTYYFYNNHVGYSGGAIYVGEGSKNCEVLNCIFDNNWVDDPTDGHGGAIEWYSEKGIVYNSIFTNNHAYDG
ncbi:MAG: hypothetical protein IJ104_08025, partial [Methanobrevibacter sp.]|nr:hypothetical protein [Methanobrevibacter sp.]